MNVAETIRQQIGHRAFVMMGAKNLVCDESSLTWKIGRNGKGVTHVTVKLDPSDTYSVTFHKVRGTKDNKHTVSDVYVDNLHRTIELNTELYLSL